MFDAIISSSPLSGIGQQSMKYAELFGDRCKFVELHNWETVPSGSTVMIYALPVPMWLDVMDRMKNHFLKVILMTICETETVHEDYGKMFDKFPIVATPSKFCQRVFQRQFPQSIFHVVNAFVRDPEVSVLSYRPKEWSNTKYTFYHIGNVADPRKNISSILKVFTELFHDKLDEVRLILKATCISEVSCNTPGVEVINGLLSLDELEKIHEQGDCYVSCSFSEGIGLGAVEAALRAKPVIFAEYGGAPEYISSPYKIPCGRTKLAADDFLFKTGMEWGNPDLNKLKEFMWKAFHTRDTRAGHPLTQYAISREKVMRQFASIP